MKKHTQEKSLVHLLLRRGHRRIGMKTSVTMIFKQGLNRLLNIPDALPLSYERRIKANANELGSYDRHPGTGRERYTLFYYVSWLVYMRYVYPRKKVKKATFTNHGNSSPLQVGFSQKNVKYVGKF